MCILFYNVGFRLTWNQWNRIHNNENVSSFELFFVARMTRSSKNTRFSLSSLLYMKFERKKALVNDCIKQARKWPWIFEIIS
jgi:hypothetical protein